ncbi:MATE family efflux transporter [Endozoicomonas numazuensis]|uniref:Multidrug-efflux transporter n=1 Tax=Endozoicomonas numazuensis TaxID=1137799 RepID=A0A081NCT1_9GAMM|nr:MATE family efflux transporter [Endozoicomonas numazuensis]KEQ16254.1 multidrug transporter MatE [Endozoicomonas numazuensis]
MNKAAFMSASADREFFSKLWRLALPVSLQSMMFSLLGLIDILMVGQLGETAVAAVGLGNRIFFFNLILTASLGSGMSILASQFIGSGDTAGLRRTLVQSLLTSVLISLPFVAFYILLPDVVIGLSTHDPELTRLAVEYLLITAPSIICTAIVVPLEAAMRASGDARTPTRVGFYAILLNVFLNYVLIFGHFGFPELGVAGSAWGTTLSRFFQTALLLWYINQFRSHLIPKKKDVEWGMKKKDLGRYFKVSVPIVLQDGSWALGLIIYSIIYASMGVNELAIMSAISSIEAILISLFIGFGVGGSIILGQELGAQRFDKAWRQGWMMLLMSPFIALFIGALLIVFRTDVVSLFGKFQGSTMTLAEQAMIVASLGLCIRVINLMGIIGLLRSGGDVKATAIINIAAMWGIGIPMAWLAVQWGFPLYMVFIFSLFEELSKAMMVLFRVFSRRWLKNLVSEPVTQST